MSPHRSLGDTLAAASDGNARFPSRVLLYTARFAPSTGGTETFAARLAGGLVESGLAVRLITDTAASEEPEGPPCPVVRRPSRRRMFELVRWADVVHLSGFDLPLFLLAKVLHKPVVWTHHDYGPTECARPELARKRGGCGPLHFGICWPRLRQRSSFVGSLRSYLRQWVQLGARYLVEANVVILESHRRALNIEGAHVIPYWTEPRQAAKPETRPSPATVVFASRHAAGKGGDVLLRALARLLPTSAEWRVVLAGDGPERRQWMSLAARLGVPAEFPGALPWQRIPDLLRQADVAVVPTVYCEYFGIIALEAMLEGIYVIASASGGLGQFVCRCQGGTFPPGDDSALAGLLQAVLSDRRQAAVLGANVREQAARLFPRAESICAYVRLYESFSRKSARSARPFEAVRSVSPGRSGSNDEGARPRE